MWPWLMIVAGTLLIIGALVARHRMMKDYRAQLDEAERADAARVSELVALASGEHRRAPSTITHVPATPAAQAAPLAPAAPSASAAPSAPAAEQAASPAQAPAEQAAPAAPAAPVPAFARAARTSSPTTRREVRAARAAGQPVVTGPPPLFADLPVGHRLTTAPTVRVRSQDVPLQDWLRYYAEGNAWSGVIQSVSDRVTGDPLLRDYVATMDRATLQRHVMTTVMMLTGEGVTVGAVRRLAEAHQRHVQSGGKPVTEPVWNRMAATLGNALREHSAPEAAILSLNATVSPLRSALVARDGA